MQGCLIAEPAHQLASAAPYSPRYSRAKASFLPAPLLVESLLDPVPPLGDERLEDRELLLLGKVVGGQFPDGSQLGIDCGERAVVGLQEPILARDVVAPDSDDGFVVDQYGNRPERVHDLVGVLDPLDSLGRVAETDAPGCGEGERDARREEEPEVAHLLEGIFHGFDLVMRELGIDIALVRGIGTRRNSFEGMRGYAAWPGAQGPKSPPIRRSNVAKSRNGPLTTSRRPPSLPRSLGSARSLLEIGHFLPELQLVISATAHFEI